jgi:DNA modification methylase
MPKFITPSSRLIHGDCLAEMAKLPAESVDIVLTDPPYGMGFQSNRSKKGPRHAKIVGDESVDSRWIAEASRLLTPHGGALVMFCDWKTSCQWRHDIEGTGLTVVSQIIWDREHHGMGDLTGAFAPMHDVIWYATKGRRTFKNGRPKSVFRCRRPSPTEDNGHPTCKPLDLIRGLLAALDRGGLVLDNFMGSGTTGVACRALHLPFIGIEVEKTYFDIAVKRINP